MKRRIEFFSTAYCPSCKFMKPKIKELYPHTHFVELDNDMGVADTFGISTVPTILFFVDDVVVSRLQGKDANTVRFEADLVKHGFK